MSKDLTTGWSPAHPNCAVPARQSQLQTRRAAAMEPTQLEAVDAAEVEKQIQQLERAAMEAHQEAQALNKQLRFEGGL